ncbi:MAG: helix-turn-helix transcriptional regulator [Actinomycetota bacterium]
MDETRRDGRGDEALEASDADARAALRSALDEDQRAVYIISVAAELAGVHPQTLRIYERKGLLAPKRTAGNTRRYSAADIARLRAIQVLTQTEGINLAGVKMIMQLQERMAELQHRAEQMQRELQRRRRERAGGSAEIVPLRTWLNVPWSQ